MSKTEPDSSSDQVSILKNNLTRAWAAVSSGPTVEPYHVKVTEALSASADVEIREASVRARHKNLLDHEMPKVFGEGQCSALLVSIRHTASEIAAARDAYNNLNTTFISATNLVCSQQKHALRRYRSDQDWKATQTLAKVIFDPGVWDQLQSWWPSGPDNVAETAKSSREILQGLERACAILLQSVVPPHAATYHIMSLDYLLAGEMLAAHIGQSLTPLCDPGVVGKVSRMIRKAAKRARRQRLV
ncbi:hypothetical protein PV08_07177 [Exophiala spinifera]|uniref:Uncharacterized protein n=1 Tax=Exophiala spinifera TaxID=91928 RepID=A0A0D2B6U0_9EURO|nr:uncharacterized protein PV08_07177 [Exophiala spinifera]KIW14395.1 hypothetical protein PV08_07177 [Exophiala spinifera]